MATCVKHAGAYRGGSKAQRLRNTTLNTAIIHAPCHPDWDLVWELPFHIQVLLTSGFLYKILSRTFVTLPLPGRPF